MTDQPVEAETTVADNPGPGRLALLDRLRGTRGQSLAAVMLKGFGVGSAMVLQWLVVRLYGPTGQGLFGLMATTLSLAGTLAVMGQDAIAIRNIAGDLAEGKPGHARAQAKAGLRIVMIGSILVSLGLGAVAFAYDQVLANRATALILLAGLPTAACIAIGRTYSFVARASGTILRSQLVDGPIPSGMGVLLVSAMFLLPERPPVWVLGATYAFSNLVALWLGSSIGRKAFAGWPDTQETVSSRPLLVAGVSRVFSYANPFFIDWLIIFTMTAAWGSKDAGLMRIPALFVSSLFLIAIAFDAVFAPRIAAALRLKDMAATRRLYRSYVKGSFAFVAVVGGMLLAVPEQILGAFGPEFVPYANILRIGVLLQLATVAMGPAGLLLVMSHNDRATYVSNIGGVVAACLICAFAIPVYGVEAGILASPLAVIAKRLVEVGLASWKLRLRLVF